MTARGDKTHRNQSQELKYTAFWGHSTQEQRMLRTVTASEGTATQKREKSDIQRKSPDSSRKGKTLLLAQFRKPGYV